MSKLLAGFRMRGFTLIELLAVISIILVVAAFITPAVNGMLKGGNFSKDLNELSDCLEQARAAAMAGNTYVWVGFLPVASNSPGNVDGINKILVAAILGKNGQTSDLTQGTYIPLNKGRVLKFVTPQQFAPQVLQGSGRESAGVDDISASNLSGGSPYKFTQTIGQENVAAQPPTFTELIQFGPLGNARITPTASRWIEIGMQSSPGNPPVTGVVQINGLTGQVRVFRQ